MINYSSIRHLLSSHLPALDGLRGLAILFVVFHNVATKGVGEIEGLVLKSVIFVSDSGWVGVELFFVLSGFLITGILLDGQRNEHQLRNFYARRSLRIFPLYYAFLIFIFIVLPLVSMMPVWLENARPYEAWYWLYLINWVQPFHSEIELGHLWSLSIEEQFYLLWPFLVIYLHRRTLVYVCLGLVISAMAARLIFVSYLPNVGTDVAYTFTVARYDALAVGALVALILRDKEWFGHVNTWGGRLAAFVLLVLSSLIVINHGLTPSSGFLGFSNQTLVAVVFGLFIFKCVFLHENRSSLLYRILSTRALTRIGKYSYAIYIFHVPIKFIWFPQYSLDPMNYEGVLRLWPVLFNFIGVLLISTLLASVSWRLIEQPFLRYKRYFSR